MSRPRGFYRACMEAGFGRPYDNSVPYAPGSLDCIRFTYAVLVKLYPDNSFWEITKVLHLSGYHWGATNNVDCLVKDIGIADYVRDTAIPGLYYCQGWGAYGHNFFLHRRRNGTLWMIEVTNLNPTGCHRVTEDQLRDTFPHLAICRLRT